MSAADDPAPTLVSRNRPLMLVGVMMAMVLQTLDGTIANVALPHMKASLGATQDTITWVLTSYVLASAVAMPLAGWLVDRLGIRTLIIMSVVAFTLASMLCGAAQSLNEMVLCRVLQGLAGAFLSPLAQTVILDSSTPRERPRMMAIYVQGALLGPIMGPIIGGFLTEYYNWRWVFYVNLPLGIISLLLLIAFMPQSRRVRRPVDLPGWLYVGAALCSIQLLLDRGETVDWFSSAEVVIYAVIAVSAAWLSIVHLATARAPLFPIVLFRDPNFVVGTVFSFLVGLVVYSSMALLPGLLQSIYGYPAIDAGLLLAPRGVGMFVSIIAFGRYMDKLDPRIAAGFGLLVTAASVMLMTRWSVEMPMWPILLSGLMQGVGVAFMFMPLNLIAFSTVPASARTDGSSLISLSRSLGSSFGVAAASVLLARSIQINHAEIGASITRMSVPLDLDRMTALGRMAEAAAGTADGMVNRQAAMIAYLNDFSAIGWFCLIAAPFLLLVRVNRPVANQDPAAK
ncbi:MAG: DHA2 family efflux MFS transporter permease subunit [Pseudomonadota bacterium]